MNKKIKNPTEYFLAHFQTTPDACWFWNGNMTKSGYGRFAAFGNTFYAHRFSYNHYKGEIPEGLHLDHLCRNRNCVNPNHLEPVTKEENIKRGYKARFDNRTHCKNGHYLTDESSSLNRANHKICLICERISQIKARKTKIERKLERLGPFCPFCKGNEQRPTNHLGHHTKPLARAAIA